jgi:hypothetical protein
MSKQWLLSSTSLSTGVVWIARYDPFLCSFLAPWDSGYYARAASAAA